MNQHCLPRLRRRWVFLLLAPLVACGDRSDPTSPGSRPSEPARVELPQAAITLFVPESTSIVATVRDASNQILPDATVLYTSRDSSTAQVDGQGTLSAVAGGDTWVVASAGTAADSMAVTARYAVDPDRAVARIREADGSDRSMAFGADGWYVHDLAGPDASYAVLEVADSDGANGVVVALPGVVNPGATPIGTVSPEAFEAALNYGSPSDFPGPVAYAVLEGADGQPGFFLSVPGGRMELDTLTTPARLGGTGRAEGLFAFRAVRHELGFDGGFRVGPPTGDTITIHVDFSAAYADLPVGYASFTLLDGPYPMVAEHREAWGYLFPVGDELRSVVYVEDGPPEVQLNMRSASPGTLRFESGPDAAASLGLYWWYAASPVVGFATTGTVTIDEVSLPSDGGVGIMSGSTQGRLQYDTLTAEGEAVVADSGSVTLSFVVPLFPDDAWGGPARRSSRTAARGRLGGLRLFGLEGPKR